MKYIIEIILVLFLLVAIVACESLSLALNAGNVHVNMAANETAYVYENKETGELLYCSNEHNGQPQDFEYKGTAEVPESKIVTCYLQ